MGRLGLIVLSIVALGGCAGTAEQTSPPVVESQASAPSFADVAEVHDLALVIDAHADIEIPGKISRYAAPDGTSDVSPARMRSGGVDAVVMAIAVGPMPRNEAGYMAARARADEELAAINELVADPEDDIVLVHSPEQLLAAHEAGERALILGFQNAHILGQDVTQLDHFHRAGVQVFALTHMGHNDYADSSRPLFIAELGRHEPSAEHGGLSDLGRSAVDRINAFGGILDISQLSQQAALQVIEQSPAPVIASHSNVRGLTDVSRNLSDEELDALAAKGGVIHIAPFRGYLFDSSDEALVQAIKKVRVEAGVAEEYLYPFELYWEIEDPVAQREFLTAVSDLLGPGRLDDMLDHIDYVVERVGVDHVGIGTDFNHGSGIEGFEDASGAMSVTAGLLARGYSPKDIAAIWGGNFLRVWHQARQAATM